MPLRVALASCRGLSPGEVDDRPLVEALRARGLLVDGPAWDDPGVDWADFDLVLLRTTWDYVERREEFCAWCERVEGLTRLENPARVVRWNTDKRYLGELEAAGLATIPSVEVSGPADLAVLRAWEGVHRRAFLKPVVGANSSGTLRFDCDESGRLAALEHVTVHGAFGPLLLQPYLERVESEGELSIVWLAGQRTHAVRKVPVPGDYRVQDDFGASDAACEPSPAELALAERAIEHVGDLLYARVDLLTDAQGMPRILELELVEPSLFFRHAPEAAEVLADGVVARLERP